MKNRIKLIGPWRLLLINALLLLCKTTKGDVITVHPNSKGCVTNSESLIACDYSNTTESVKILATDWKDLKGKKGYSINGASSLTLEPQSNARDLTLYIYNSKNVHSAAKDRSDLVQLYLINSTAGNLQNMFNLINVEASSIKTIDLDVDMFDIKHSNVSNLNIRSTKTNSTVIDSRIDVVNKMAIDGSYKLEITDSRFGTLKQFIYSSSFSGSEIVNTTVESVAENGFKMVKGELHLNDVTFTNLASEAIVVYGGTLQMEDVTIITANEKSFVMRGDGGRVKFVNVSIGDDVQLTFELGSSGSGDVWPIATAFADPESLFPTSASIIIGIIVGFIIGIIIGGILRYFHCCEALFTKSKDEEKKKIPLTTVAPLPTQTWPNPPTPLINNSVRGKPEEDIGDDTYEDYQDVGQSAPSLPPPFTQSPTNLCKPNHISNTNQYFTQPTNVPPLPTTQPPRPLPNPPHPNHSNTFPSTQETENTDDAEDIYDEWENVVTPIAPPAPLTKPTPPSKPMAPLSQKPLPPKRDGRDGYSSNQSISQQTLPALKPTNKPSSFLHTSAKPPPPPRDRSGPVKPQANVITPVLKQTGGRPTWPPPPQMPADQSKHSNSIEEEEDIYEMVPDF